MLLFIKQEGLTDEKKMSMKQAEVKAKTPLKWKYT